MSGGTRKLRTPAIDGRGRVLVASCRRDTDLSVVVVVPVSLAEKKPFASSRSVSLSGDEQKALRCRGDAEPFVTRCRVRTVLERSLTQGNTRATVAQRYITRLDEHERGLTWESTEYLSDAV